MTVPKIVATGASEIDRLPVIVVGAGMAGLVAAVALHESGIPVHVFEASDGVGGRIRSDRRDDGFILDRGFQVLLDAYPAARRWIDHGALDCARFDAGALLWTGRRLVPLVDGVPCVTVFLAGSREPGTGPRLVLDATRQLLVNHLAPLSAVQPAYAPAGQHLLAAVIVGDAAREGDLDALSRRARDDAAIMLDHEAADWRVLESVRVPFSQYAQPPGIYRRLPGNVTPTRGLYLASEATIDSSYNGAMWSGETAAGIVRRELAIAPSEV